MLKTHRSAFKIIKRFHYLDHDIGPLIILLGIVKGVVPFIPIVFSKHILTAVINKGYQEALYYAITMAISYGIGNIISAWLVKITVDKSEDLSIKIKDLLHKKPLELDYESMESGEVINGYTNAISALRYKANFGSLYKKYSELLQGLVSFAVAFILTVQLCLSVSKSQVKILNTFANPVVSLGIILIGILGMLFMTGKLVNWSQNKISQLFNEKLDSERRFTYLARMSRDEEMIKIIQAYNAFESVGNLLFNTSTYIKKNYKKQGIYWILERIFKASSSGLVSVLAYVLVVVKILAGAIGVDSFLKHSQAVIKMNDSLLAIIVVNYELTDMMRYMHKLTEFLDIENRFETGSIPVENVVTINIKYASRMFGLDILIVMNMCLGGLPAKSTLIIKAP